MPDPPITPELVAAYSLCQRKSFLLLRGDTGDCPHEYVTLIEARASSSLNNFLEALRTDGFMRIRHFGFLANRTKKQALSRCRELLGLNPLLPKIPDSSTQDILRELTGVDLSRCPACKKGTMVVVAELPKLRPWDSS